MSETPPETPPEGRPAWLPEQFETPEAMAEAYANLRPEMNRLQTEMQRERDTFAAALEGMQQATPTPPQYGAPQQYDPAMSAYAAAYEAGDVQGMLAAQAQYTMAPTIDAVGRLIDEKLGQLAPQVQAAATAQREHDLRLAEGLAERQLGPDKYAQLLPRIRELAADNPNWLPSSSSVEGYASSILNIAKLAEHDHLQRTVAELEQERSDKLAAQTLSGGYNRPQADQDAARAEFDRIKNPDRLVRRDPRAWKEPAVSPIGTPVPKPGDPKPPPPDA